MVVSSRGVKNSVPQRNPPPAVPTQRIGISNIGVSSVLGEQRIHHGTTT